MKKLVIKKPILAKKIPEYGFYNVQMAVNIVTGGHNESK